MDVCDIKEYKSSPDIFHSYTEELKNSGIPIVIDNGSYVCRVGWANNGRPNLIFKNILARPRKDRVKKEGETLIGNDITNIEAVRFLLKTQFDRNVVTQFEIQEQIFDYTFYHLGIDTEGYVNHPIFITELFLNPNYSRALMSELLFEGYRVPSVCYGVDMLLSYYHNKGICSTSLIVSVGYHCTHVIPVIDNKVDLQKCKRIDVGGFHITNFFHKLLQLKYPAHFNAITLSRAEALLFEYGYVATDYQEEISCWANADYYDKNVKLIQLPYHVQPVSLTPDQQREKRKELARKLVEINARKREEKLVEDRENLKQLHVLQKAILSMSNKEDVQRLLQRSHISNINELQKLITKLETKIKKVKEKASVPPVLIDEPASEEPKIKIMKTDIKLPTDDENLQEWVENVYKKRKNLLEKRNVRKQLRQDMAKRGTAAAQQRMRLINQLARKDKYDDDFGIRDEDWDVYKAINKEGGDTDSEEEHEKLLEMEELLKYYDPLFDDGTNEKKINTKEAHQLHIGLERIRAPELLFQPSMIGSSQAGIAETVEFVLKGYSSQRADELANNVFLTGGPVQMPGFLNRMEKELLEMRPFKSTFSITKAKEPTDSWFGARKFCMEQKDYWITAEDYREKGKDYILEHFASNPYIKLPVPESLDNLTEN